MKDVVIVVGKYQIGSNNSDGSYRDHEALDLVMDALMNIREVYAERAPNIGESAVYQVRTITVLSRTRHAHEQACTHHTLDLHTDRYTWSGRTCIAARVCRWV